MVLILVETFMCKILGGRRNSTYPDLHQPRFAPPIFFFHISYQPLPLNQNSLYIMDKEQTITQALKDLEDGRFPSIRACARAYALDHTLLVRRRRGQQDRVASHSNQQNLSPLQESLLATYLIQAEKAGHAFNHVQLRDLASLIMKTGGNKKKLGEH